MSKIKGFRMLLLLVVLSVVIAISLVGCQKSSKDAAGNSSGTDKDVETVSGIAIEKRVESARQFIELFLSEDYLEVLSAFPYTDAMKKGLTEKVLNDVKSSISKDLGGLVSRWGYVNVEQGEFDIYSFAVVYEKGNVAFNVVFDKMGLVGGFHYRPLQTLDGYEENWDENLESNQREESPFKTEAVEFGEASWKLSGTLTYPDGEGPFPAVVIVHGSGPSDRDGTVMLNKPYADLADGLARQGIASLRYDKRTYTHLQAIQQLEDITIEEEMILDALYAVELTMAADFIDSQRVFLVGHSLGGNQAPRIAQREPKLAGIVMLCANVTPLHELMLTQVRYLSELDGEVSADEKQQIEMIEEVVALLNDPGYDAFVDASKTLGLPYSYWKDLIDYDPIEIAKTLKMPMYLVQGGRDYQVPLAEFDLWTQGLPEGATYKVYEEMNHLLMPGEGMPSPAEYQIKSVVLEEMILDLAAWILSN